MATTKAKRAKSERRYPERKWGPFAGGSGVAVWLNEFQTENGTRYARSITFAPRRFRDRKTDEWRDGASGLPCSRCSPRRATSKTLAASSCKRSTLPNKCFVILIRLRACRYFPPRPL